MKKRFNGKRILAIALALTMLVSEVGMVQAAPADEQAVEAVSEEAEVVSGDATTEVASEEVTEVTSEETTEVASEEATEVASEEATEATSEEEVVISSEEELEVQEESTEVAKPTVTELTKPGKVVLRQDWEAVDGIIDMSVVTWARLPEADYYQVRVVGADGMEFAYDTEVLPEAKNGENQLTYRKYGDNDTNRYDMDDIVYLNYEGYSNKDNVWSMAYTEEKNAEGVVIDKDYFYIEQGQTYSVYIRAVNTGKITVTNEDGTTSTKDSTVYGDWSDAVSYALPAAYTVEKITDVKITESENGQSTLTFKKGKNQYAQLEIKDSQGREYFAGYYYSKYEFDEQLNDSVYRDVTLYPYYNSSESYDLDDDTFDAYLWETKEGEKLPTMVEVKDKDGKPIPYVYMRPFQPGETYTIRVRGVVGTFYGEYEKIKENQYSEWSEPVTYTCADNKMPETPGQLEYDEDNNEVDWTSAKYASGYEVELKDASGNWFNDWDYVKDEATGKYKLALINRTSSSSYLNVNPEENTYYSYKLNAEGTDWDYVVDADKKEITAPQKGTTYSIRVRAYNYNKAGKEQYSDWTAPLTFTIPKDEAPVTGVAPTKIAGVTVSEEGIIKWAPEANIEKNNESENSNERTTHYEIEVKDNSGREYYPSWSSKTDAKGNTVYEFKCQTTTDTSINLGNDSLGTYTMLDGTPVPVKYPESSAYYNRNVYAFDGGQTYTVRVRAYRYLQNKAGDLYYNGSYCPIKVAEDGSCYYEMSNGSKGQLYKDKDGDYYTSYKFPNIKTAEDGSYYYEGYNGQYKLTKDAETGDYLYESGSVYASCDTNKVYTKACGDWSDAVSCAVPVDTTSVGVNAKPAQVTGLWIQTESKSDKSIKIAPIMYWNQIENVSHYEVEIKDSKGNLYTEEQPAFVNQTYVTQYPTAYAESGDDIDSAFYPLSDYEGFKSYIKADGVAMTTVKNADGTDAKTFQVGETYTIRVRAINRYSTYDATTDDWSTAVEYQGDWSEPVTYTPAVKEASAVTGLYYVKSDDDYYYFTYNADVVDSQLYYQVALDDKFNSASIVSSGWVPIYGNNKLAISKTAGYLEPSTTYYVKVVNSKYGYPSVDLEVSKYNEVLATAAVTSFTTEAKKVYQPKNITGLKVYSEDEYGYTLRFDAVLEGSDKDGNYYELQISPSNAENSWRTVGTNTCSLSKSSLSAGTNYVRVIAYVWQEDEHGEEKKVYGQPSNVLTLVNDDAMTAIGKIKLLEHYNDYYYVSYTGNLRLDEDIEIWYSDSKNFETNSKTVDTTVGTRSANVNKRFSINYTNMKPGKTYYVKARTINKKSTCAADKYSAFSNVIKIKTEVPKVSVEDAVVTKNSIKLNLNTVYDDYRKWVTGFEIQKKSVKNKKTTWTTISRSSASTYTDKKLKADKTYTYRVRAYYFDYETNKIVDGAWTYYEAMTGWSGSLKLQAKAASKTSIKLTWSKIKGAKGYEIYRYVTSSSTSQISNGEGNGYSKYKQIAKVSSSKKNYTDKKLTAGMTYSYIVKAYKTVGGKKVYIEDSASASLDFELTGVKVVAKSNGKVTVSWNPVYSAKGYLIEKQDEATGKWNKYKTIKKAKTSSITLPAAKNKELGDYYRIRAYKGTEYTSATLVRVNPVLAAPTKVKAKATKDGIKISWKAVKGADYYRVFRTTSADIAYNKDLKTYTYYDNNGYEVGRYVADNTKVSGYRYRDLEDMNVTSVEDKKIVYSVNGYDEVLESGPDTGVKYYYYVIAYKNEPQHEYIYENGEANYYASGASKSASATIKESKPAKTSISKISSKKKKVTITFKASKDADGYEIARSTKKKKGYKVIGTVNSPDTLKYVDKYNKKTNKIKKGKTYYYKVRAFKYNDDGTKVYSKYSSVKKVKVK